MGNSFIVLEQEAVDGELRFSQEGGVSDDDFAAFGSDSMKK